MSTEATLVLRLRGDDGLVSSLRTVLLPDFKGILSDEKVTRLDEGKEWELVIEASSMARLRAFANSIMRAISLIIEVDRMVKGSAKGGSENPS